MDDPRQNQLLAMLPEHNFAYISNLLERVELCSGDILSEPEAALRYVYFPITGLICKLNYTENGASSELGLIGNEGMLGSALYLGGEIMPHQSVVVIPGYAYRLCRNRFEEEINRIGGQRSGALHGILLRYTQALIMYVVQIAACNRQHSIEQQLCRWLLMVLDRQSVCEIAIAQQSIATMLGVRRESITEAVGKLQQVGLIRYYRGHISVLERAGLEAQSCECYQIIKTEFDRLLAIRANPSPFSKPIPEINTYGHAKDTRRHLALG